MALTLQDYEAELARRQSASGTQPIDASDNSELAMLQEELDRRRGAGPSFADRGSVSVALPEGMTEEDVFKNRKMAQEEAWNNPGQKAFNQRVREGQKAGYYSTEKEDPQGANRPQRLNVKGAISKLTGSGLETPDTESAKEALSVGSGDFIRDTKRGVAFLLGSEPEERMQMLQSMDEGASFRYDEKGNLFVKFSNGEEGVLNKPGYSREDALRIISEIGKFSPAAKVAGAGKNVFSKMLLGGTGSGATSMVSEGAQVALDGNFDSDEVLVETIFGGTGELLVPFVKFLGKKLTTSGRQSLANAKTLDDLVDAGLDRQKIGGLVKEYQSVLKEAQDMKIKPPLAAQLLAGETSKDFQRPLSRLTHPSKGSDALARRFTEYLEERSQVLSGAIKNTLYRFQKSSTRDALETARTTAQDLIQSKVDARSGFASIMYEKAFKDAPKIDLEDLRLDVDELIETTGLNTQAEKKLKKIKTLLDTREYRAAMADRAKKMADAEAHPVYDSDGNVSVPDIPMPAREIDPRILQQVNWELRDIIKLPPNKKSTTASVKYRVGQMERRITDALNKSTQGGYGKADKLFADMSEAISELQEGMVGEAASKSDTTLKTLVTSVFNPRPEQVPMAKKFMNLLRSQDKAAADDLYASYFMSKLDNLDENAKPSEIYKAIFGKGEDQANLILSLSPDPTTTGTLSQIRRQLNIAGRGDGVSLTKSSDAVVAEQERGGFVAVMARMFTPFQESKRFFHSISTKKRAALMFEAALDEKWVKELHKIIRLDPTNAELDKMIDGFYQRMAARSQIRSMGETIEQGSVQAAGEQSTE